MKIEEATKLLQNQYNLGDVSVGIGQDNIIYVYELVRGLSKKRLNEFEGFKVINKFIGKIKPC